MSDEESIKPTDPRRLGYRALEIVLGRLPVGRWCRDIPGLHSLYTRELMARRDSTALFSGLYPSYAAAIDAIPASRKSGWDHEATAQLWLGHIDPIRLSTYPIFFWLGQLFRDNDALVDVGGSIGLTYYGYRKLAALPPGATWTVVEVTRIAEQGRQVAAQERAAGLHFVAHLKDAGRCDILLSAGALQFMEHSLPGLLESLPNSPRYLLLNKLPVTSQEDCWTLHNYGPAVTPNRLFNEQKFLDYFAGHGYRLRDRWAVEDLNCLIPFYPERYIRQFAGFFFELC